MDEKEDSLLTLQQLMGKLTHEHISLLYRHTLLYKALRECLVTNKNYTQIVKKALTEDRKLQKETFTFKN